MNMRVATALTFVAAFSGCATHSTVRSPGEPPFVFRNYTLTVGHRSPEPCPDLVRIRRDGTSIFRFYMPEVPDAVEPDGYQYTETKPGELLTFSDMDFTAKLLTSNYAQQRATIRVYDLGKHL